MTQASAPLALSTGQAARYCFVTSETILSWIRTGQLEAQRTAGGQYRIRVPDLRKFLVDNGMSTELLDEETGSHPYCWQFHRRPAAERGAGADVCRQCPVYKAAARACWELHHLLPADRRRVAACERCDYFKRYGGG